MLAGQLALFGAIAPAASAESAAVANGKPQVVREHRLPQQLPVSQLPEIKPLAGAASGLARRYGGTPIDVLTYHYDSGRDGWNRNETDLTVAGVASGKFGLLTTLTVDGYVFAQPLLVSGFRFPDGTTHDVLVVVTGHDSVYAFDAQTYAQLWTVNFGPSQNSNDVGCGDVKPEYGISSTPVIVRSAANAATLYVVSATEPSPFSFHSYVHALNLADGSDVAPPAEIAPSAKLSDGSTLSFDPQNQWSRSGLAYGNGALYVSIGSHCDNNPDNISGWLLRYSPALSLEHAFHTVETPHGYELASIWMSGFAPALDGNGNIFVVTGNGDYTGRAKDWGESVLKIAPSASNVISHFTPASYNELNAGDTDFGSGGAMLLPAVAGQSAPPMVAAIGKDAVLYLLNQDALGGKRANDAGALQSTRIGGSGNGLWGGPAFYDGPNGPTIYAQINNDVLRSFSVGVGSAPTLTAGATGTTIAGPGGSMPIVSSNGNAAGTGIVWLIRRSAPVQLEAYDAAKLGAPIYTANVGSWSQPAHGRPFLTPMEANGRVYAPSFNIVRVFGLTD